MGADPKSGPQRRPHGGGLVEERHIHNGSRRLLIKLGIHLALIAGATYFISTFSSGRFWLLIGGWWLGIGLLLLGAVHLTVMLLRPQPSARADGVGVWMHMPRAKRWQLGNWQHLKKVVHNHHGQEPAVVARFTEDPDTSGVAHHRWLVFFLKDAEQSPGEVVDMLMDPGHYAPKEPKAADAIRPKVVRAPQSGPLQLRTARKGASIPLGWPGTLGILAIWLSTLLYGAVGTGLSLNSLLPTAFLILWIADNTLRPRPPKLRIEERSLVYDDENRHVGLLWREVMGVHEIFTNQGRSYIALHVAADTTPVHHAPEPRQRSPLAKALSREAEPPFRAVQATLPETEQATGWHLLETTELAVPHDRILAMCFRGAYQGWTERNPGRAELGVTT